MDLDLLWGPLLFLRPPKTPSRLNSPMDWLKYIAVGVALSVTLGIPAGLLLVYYDYATAADAYSRKRLPLQRPKSGS